MIRERDPFGRALTILRQRLANGDFAEGEPLIIIDLARELDLSPTPVREALQRLVGEGLVEERRGRGYFNWRIDVADLAELYDLSSLLIGASIAAVAARGRPDHGDLFAGLEAEPDVGPEAVVRASERLFARLVRAAGNRAMTSFYISVASRLGPARRAEHHILSGGGAEMAALMGYAHAGAWRDLATSTIAFHDRRREQASAIVAATRAQAK